MAGSNIARLLIASALLLACGAAAAAQTVPGERWQHKMTMQMGGMSMPIPGGEVCAPAGQAAQELAKPDKNCTVSNVRQSGNRFSADVKCTGKEAMEGTMEMTTGPDLMTGKMTVRSADGEMTMVTESRKLGACQAVDTGAVVAQAEAQAQKGRQMAAQAEAQTLRGRYLQAEGGAEECRQRRNDIPGTHRGLRGQAAACGVLRCGAVAGRIRGAFAGGGGAAGRGRPQPRGLQARQRQGRSRCAARKARRLGRG